ncbi:DUF7586 domain-containing protein [Micromonospora sp. NPDC003776]
MWTQPRICGGRFRSFRSYRRRAVGDVARVEAGHLVLGEPGEGARGSHTRPVGAAPWIGLDGYHAGEPLRVAGGPAGPGGYPKRSASFVSLVT